MSTGKESFILYTAFYKPISNLSDEQLGRLLRAIFAYNLGEDVVADSDIWMAFEFFKNQMDFSERKYRDKIKRDIENGRKGGNPNFKRGQPNPYRTGKSRTADKPGSITPDNPALSEITPDNPNDNVNDNVNANENENANANENDNAALPIDASIGSPDEAPADRNDKPKPQKTTYAALLDFFNSQMDMHGAAVPRIHGMSEARKRSVKARCREFGEDALRQAIEAAARSDFLNGKNARGWTATFDWLIAPANFAKVIEGNYNNAQTPQHIETQPNDRYARRRGADSDARRPEDYTGAI